MLDVERIRDVLPHRYPFLLVDRILELVPNKSARGCKNVTINEEFFEGHFPGHAVMPGVLVCEAMAQVGGVLLLSMTGNEGKLAYFGGMDRVRFRRPVVPGDTLVTDVDLIATRGNVGKMKAVARVDGGVAAEGEFTFALVDRGTTLNEADNVVETKKGRGSKEQMQTTDTKTEIHSTALVDPSAQLGRGIKIGAYCVIGVDVCIGDDTRIDPHVVIESNTTLGRNCTVMSGAVLGGAPQDYKYSGEPTHLRIGDENVIRECVTIHRASGEGETTTMGNNNMLMAYCHIGHNCTIGDNITMANYVGISGHVLVEDKVVFGGIVGVHQNVRIGKLAMVGGMSKVVQDVPPFAMADGRPTRVCDLNVIGLRRNGVAAKTRTDLKNAYKLLYRSDLNVSQALEAIEEQLKPSEELAYLLDFVRNVRLGFGGRQLEAPRD